MIDPRLRYAYRSTLVAGFAGSVAALHSSLQRIVMDTVVGVTIAIALFALYYAIVLRRAGDRGSH